MLSHAIIELNAENRRTDKVTLIPSLRKNLFLLVSPLNLP